MLLLRRGCFFLASILYCIKYSLLAFRARSQKLSFEHQLLWQDEGFDSSRPGEVCVFASYSFKSKIDDYVLHYLNELRLCGWRIVFVSSSEVSSLDLERLKPHCAMVVQKSNDGYDFGAWCLGLKLLHWGASVEKLLLTNDSIFGPLVDLRPLFARHRSHQAWGLADSFQIAHHLQSYFICLSGGVLRHPSLQRFWKNLMAYNIKSAIIFKHEIGLSRAIRQTGETLQADVSYLELCQYLNPEMPRYSLGRIWPLNPSIDFWKILLLVYNFPFLKRELFRTRSMDRFAANDILEVLAKHCSYSPSLIRNFLSGMNQEWVQDSRD